MRDDTEVAHSKSKNDSYCVFLMDFSCILSASVSLSTLR